MRDPPDRDTLEPFDRFEHRVFHEGDSMNPTDRVLGGLWGLVVGDALGVPVQFQPREAVRADPVRGMDRSFKGLPPGTWSDDSSMALALAASLTESGWDLEDQMDRFERWLLHGDYTPHGESWDVGGTTRNAILRWHEGRPVGETGDTGEFRNGNGSLMRFLPAALWLAGADPDAAIDRAMAHSALTHAHVRARLCCAYHATLVRGLLAGAPLREAMAGAAGALAPRVPFPEREVLAPILSGEILDLDERDVESSGYVVHTLGASLWCLARHDDWASAVLAAVNLGGDADTTGAVTGGLAGVIHGRDAIPPDWVDALERPDLVASVVDAFEAAVPVTGGAGP